MAALRGRIGGETCDLGRMYYLTVSSALELYWYAVDSSWKWVFDRLSASYALSPQVYRWHYPTQMSRDKSSESGGAKFDEECDVETLASLWDVYV